MIPRCLMAFAIVLCWATATVADPVPTSAAPAITAATPTPDALTAQKRLRVGAGLNVSLWAGEPLVKNIVSVAYDNRGRAYVVETGRRRTSVFDIRNFTKWLDDDFSLRNVEQRVELLKNLLDPRNSQYEEFAHIAGKAGKPGGLEDFNHDGVLDWRDLEVESEKIELVRDSTGQGRADTAETFADGFHTVVSGVAAGVLAQGTNVWFTCIPDLWRFPAAGSGGKLPVEGEKLLHGFGVHIAFGGHDLHGLIKGFDGRIYFSIADRGTCVTNREGQVISLPDCGAVFRCEPDGSQLEVVAKGLRNPQELAFDDQGNLWTGDNNGDGGDKARWTLVLAGADYGWTMGWQWLPKMGAWNSERLWQTRETNTASYLVPPVAHIGHGPAGIAYYPGTGLGDQFAGHFFLADFPGGVRTFRVEPEGAFFKVLYPNGNRRALEDNSITNMEGKLLWDLSPVDVTFPPFGGAIVGDWVQGWDKTGKGRLWHVTDPALKDDPRIAEVRRILAEGFAALEVKPLASLLDHPDLRVRLEAQWELAARGETSLAVLHDTAGNTHYSTRARLHAVRALGQMARQQPIANFGNELFPLIGLLEDADPEMRAQVCIVLAEGRLENAGPALAQRLLDREPRVRGVAGLALAQLLGATQLRRATDPEHYTGYTPTASDGMKRGLTYARVRDFAVTESLVQMARENDGRDPVIAHAVIVLLEALTRKGDRAALDACASASQAPAVRLASLLVQRRLGDPAVAWWLRDGDPQLVLEAARAINDTPIPKARPALASLLDEGAGPRPPAPWPAGLHYTRNEWTYYVLRRAVNAAWHLGTAKAARSIAAVAAREELPGELRLEALDDLADWGHMPRRDRVTGLYDPLPPREGAVASAALQSIWPRITGGGANTNILLRTLSLGFALSLPEALPLAERLMSDPNPVLRAEAAKLLDLRHPLSPEQLVNQLQSGSLEQKRAALRRLGGITNHLAVEAVSKAFTQLREGTLAKELQLDVAEAAASISVLADSYKEWTRSLPSGDTLAAYRIALYGGDAANGKRLFVDRAEWGCQRCHKLEGEGGDVGPELSGVGRRRDREYVLRSILEPNAEVAPGFDSVLIELKDGTTLTGVVKSETDLVVQIQTTEGSKIAVSKKEIVSRTRGLSPMPDGLGELMTKRELRDLIEALSR